MHAAHVDMCIRCSELSQTAAVWVLAGGGTTGCVGEADGDGAGAGGAAAHGAQRPGRSDGAGAGPVHGESYQLTVNDPLSAKEDIFSVFCSRGLFTHGGIICRRFQLGFNLRVGGVPRDAGEVQGGADEAAAGGDGVHAKGGVAAQLAFHLWKIAAQYPFLWY